MPAFVVSKPFSQEVAEGRISGYSEVDKFGRATAGLQTTATDIWDRADATPTQQIWLAPTAARIHAIDSTDSGDDGSPVGVGARTVRVHGLKTWTTAPSFEDITMNGTTAVNTANAYVIIHRMKVLTNGTTNINVGTITATAASDATITAAILPGNGQTLMAIYGVPGGFTFYMESVYGHILKAAGAAASADMSILYDPDPDVVTTRFITKHTFAVVKDGSSAVPHDFDPPKQFVGPGIIKINGLASANGLDVSAGFDGILGIDVGV